MTTASTTKRPLTQLTHEIEEAEAEVARLNTDRQRLARDVGLAGRRVQYLRLAELVRRPKSSFELWPAAMLMIGPAVVGIVLFMIVHVLFGTFSLAVVGLILGAAGGAMIIAALLYRPADALLSAALADAQSQSQLAHARLKEKLERINETNARLKKLLEERRDQIASGKLQRAALLQRHWKSMRDTEWEDFVVEVLRTHGANVERGGRIGDQDANLIVDVGTHRVAVLTQGEVHSVHSGTIQHAIAAKDRHRCDRCAVIINRRFTGAAQDFAQRNGCTAIGAVEFPDFVLGKIEL